MQIIRNIGPLCPVFAEAMEHQSQRIDEFYQDVFFIVSKTPTGKFTLRIEINDEPITLSELFPTAAYALRRIEWCKRLGINGTTKYENM